MTRVMALCFILSFLIPGCTSTIKYTKPVTFAISNDTTNTWFDENQVFVINTEEYPKEYQILVKSGRFKVVDNQAAAHLRLQKVQFYGGCGNPLMGTFLTLGILPSATLSHYLFRFTIEQDGQKTEYEYILPMEQRYSLWEWLRKPFVNETAILSEALRNSAPYNVQEK